MDYQILKNHPLAPYTTLRLGGPADYFIEATSPNQLLSILNSVYQNYSPITILGNGSNVLISDSGIRGLVIKNSSQEIKILNNKLKDTIKFAKSDTQRKENEPKLYLDFTKLDYDESNLPVSEVEISSGCSLSHVINWTLDHGLTGLQWFAYIPGTIGGAIHHNIHGGSYHIADYIKSIKCFDLNTKTIIEFEKSNLIWKYEESFFLKNPNLVILSTKLNLFHGDTNKAKKVRDAWIAQKSKIQPMNSAGSTFANPSLEVCQKIWGEQKSAGWIIDHDLGWKNKSVGGAQVSEKHANFIVNNGSASAKDFYTLMTNIQADVLSKKGIALEPEIKLLGEF